ncbi:uncharacterized protein LOC124369910 [Homalodisca vitripennis]|uniref:uncharacterized protein LOC124369910 n=1 Tax=Homalodisca vitripennis TaxID=197043 RepID=UPI001EE9C4DF|nr:uncharacterized protein LOC124369910 [Homalodisca vitripennis]
MVLALRRQRSKSTVPKTVLLVQQEVLSMPVSQSNLTPATTMGVLLLAVILTSHLGLTQGKVTLPFYMFLQQTKPFEVEMNREDGAEGSLPAIDSVPLVMKFLFEAAERVSNREVLPEGGDFQSLARSFKPINIQETGLQRVELEFPPLSNGELMPGSEAWLVFQSRQSHILGYNCTQELSVYESDKTGSQPVVTVPLNYQTSDPLLVVNITESIRQRPQSPTYSVLITDSTSYNHDQDPKLLSFTNYIDCSLTRVCEVLELHDPQATPVLLLLSPEFATNNLLESAGGSRNGNRIRRNADEREKRKPEQSLRDEKNSCQLMRWEVNVEQLGWDWLIYPERIPLNLCVGKCPILLDRVYNATSHAVARGLYRLVLGQESKPENQPPCCVPVKYRRFSMLIEKLPGIISLETSSDLSAIQCGCR